MKLQPKDQEFRNPKLFYPDPKNVDLDRVLINLFLLLRCGGHRPATRGRAKASVEKVSHHVDQLAKMQGVTGVQQHAEVTRAWLETDVFDLVNRGTSREAIASLRPLHLDAHKIRVAKHCRDYNVADALYSMLENAERQALDGLRRYLDRGRDAQSGRYDGETSLDLETLTVLKLVEELPDLHRSGEKVAEEPPVCVGQARVLCDDVQRVLAYQNVMPRPVIIDYLKTLFGLHVALYTLRLSRQLTGWIRDRRAHDACRNCPVQGTKPSPFEGCPYQQTFVVDMGGDFRSQMAALAQQSAAMEYGRLNDLIKALFTMNQLLRYARDRADLGVAAKPTEVLGVLETPPADFDADFRAHLRQLRELNGGSAGDGERITSEEQAILDAGLPPFDTYVELITHVRQQRLLPYLHQMMDKLLQKNTPFGALTQGKSASNPRRWNLGGRLLEVFVQLAVLRWTDREGRKLFYSEPILIEDFLRWMEARYGFVIAGSVTGEGRRAVTLEEHRAFRENARALKDRLREIGFYDDVSDAYNAQTIQPRYPIDQRKVTA